MSRQGLIEFDAVLAIVRRGSFRAAAIELGLSTTSLSNLIGALERRLGAYRARLGRSSAASSGSPLSRSQSHSNLLEPFARGAGGWDELEPEVRSLLHWSPYDRVGVVDAVS